MSNCQYKNIKLALLVILITLVLVSVAMYAAFFRSHALAPEDVKIDGVYLKEARKDVPSFQLQATNGKLFTQENLKNRWTMMFFGFTNCGMVCPATMAALNGMYRILETKLSVDNLPQVVMISVDPERDTLARMKSYVAAFNPHFLGARAEIRATIALEKALHITAAKIEADGKGKNHYTINHSAEILLFNPEGELQAYLSYPHEAKQMAQDYLMILQTRR